LKNVDESLDKKVLCWWWRWRVSDHGGERVMVEDNVENLVFREYD